MKLSDFLEEAAIMKEMKHPNLVQVRRSITSAVFGRTRFENNNSFLTELCFLASWCLHSGAAFLYCHRVYVTG